MKISFNLVSFSALTALSLSSQAALTNLYTFNDGTANDSAGTKHGTLVNSGKGVFTGGRLDFSANGGSGDAGVEGYVNLPNGLFSAAVSGGTAGAASFSLWFTVAENRNWAPALSFGTSTSGEDNTSGGGSGADYLQLIPRAGNEGNTLRLTTHAANVGAEGFVNAAAEAPIGSLINAVGVFDGGNFSFYVNGVQIGATTAMPAALNLSTFNDNNNWLGRSQWGDPVFDGAYDQLGIYNTALSAGDIATAYAAGPVAVPETSGALLGLLGAASLAGRRRRAV
ncbi:MAG: LamG domain-containing protein [Verrucomicrobiota bacterium]